MCFMNEFVEKEIKNMKQFIDRISTPVSDAEARVEWGPHHIDLGKEASVMHTILTSQLKTAKLDEVWEWNLFVGDTRYGNGISL